MLAVIRSIRRLTCKARGHRWNYPSQFMRQCIRCGREEAVYVNRCPHIGEPQSEWLPSPTQRLKDSGDCP